MHLMNLCVIDGFLTSKPETKVFSGGKKKAVFTLGQNTYHHDEKGNSVSTGNFYICEAWNLNCDFVSVFDTGALLRVIGVLRQDHWSKDGKNYSRVKIVVQSVMNIPKPQKQEENYQDDEVTESEPPNATEPPAPAAVSNLDIF